MDEKKKVLLRRILPVVFLVSAVLIAGFAVYRTLDSSYTVIVKDSEMNYFRGKNLFIWGDTMILKKETDSVKDKSLFPEENPESFRYRILSMNEIISIEIVDKDEKIPEEPAAVAVQYTGRYKIKLQGHEGILVIGVSGEKLYGSVRFPSWGRGAVEYLKAVRVRNGEVSFVRSAATPAEIRRLGANYLFRQTFTGRFNASGRIIKGIMINDRGEKHEWEAQKK